MPLSQIVAGLFEADRCFDGLIRTAYPNGDMPGGFISSTLILYTDTTQGATTGGENNKGHYLTIYGVNLAPRFSALGDTHRVYIGGVEVDNYRYLQPAVGTLNGAIGTGVFQTWGVQALCVQVGALSGLTQGVAYPIDIKVSGASSPINQTSGGFYLNEGGFQIEFTPNPGATVFVSLTGNDANAGTIDAPLRHLQAGTAIAGLTGALFNSRGSTSPVAANACQPGTQIVIRGGSYGADSAFEGRWARLMRITGTAPTGSLGSGRIHITSYPGAAGANAPESVDCVGASGTNGGIQGNDTARSQETTPYGQTGYCWYIHISNIKVHSHATATSDSAPINIQSKGNGWRIVNCDLSWPSTVIGTGWAKGAGITGHGDGVCRYGNWIHDVTGDPANNENHGIYLDGNVVCDTNGDTAYNVIKRVTAGNGIQLYSAASSSFTGQKIHHNWVERTNKYGLNISQTAVSGHYWANVFVDSGGYAMINQSQNANLDHQIEYNTVYGWADVETNRAAVGSVGTIPSGTVKFHNNIIAQKPGRSASGYAFFVVQADGLCTLSNNRWHDFSGNLTTKPAQDSLGTYGDPLFVDKANLDFRLQSGSPCVDAGTVALTSVGNIDFGLQPRAVGAAKDIGAWEKQ